MSQLRERIVPDNGLIKNCHVVDKPCKYFYSCGCGFIESNCDIHGNLDSMDWWDVTECKDYEPKEEANNEDLPNV